MTLMHVDKYLVVQEALEVLGDTNTACQLLQPPASPEGWCQSCRRWNVLSSLAVIEPRREKKNIAKCSMDPGVDCFKDGLFGAKQICLSSLWEELEAKRLTQGHLFGYPGSNELCRSQWHQNCHHSRPMDYFTKAKQKFMKICIFAQKGPYPKTFNVFF